jgi:putative endonuclease
MEKCVMVEKDPRIPLGARGEEIAARHLRRLGYRILERGFRSARKEVDIIACDGRTVVFVEVKTRSRRDRYPPFVAVGPRKQARILGGAKAWLARKAPPAGVEVRFDVVSIVLSPGVEPDVEHIVDAFRPR